MYTYDFIVKRKWKRIYVTNKLPPSLSSIELHRDYEQIHTQHVGRIPQRFSVSLYVAYLHVETSDIRFSTVNRVIVMYYTRHISIRYKVLKALCDRVKWGRRERWATTTNFVTLRLILFLPVFTVRLNSTDPFPTLTPQISEGHIVKQGADYHSYHLLLSSIDRSILVS